MTRPAMSAIDAHVHAFPDSLAGRAIAALEEGSPWKAIADGTVGELLKSMDAAGVEASVLCTIATKPEQVGPILSWCERIKSPRIIPLPSVHPDTPQPSDWLSRFARDGFLGIKLHPQYQDVEADSPRLDAIYASAEELGLIVESHCGRDIAFPPDDDRASPERFARVLRRHSGLKLICTHMGGWSMWAEAQKHLLGTNVYLETSFSLKELGPSRAADMIRRHGPGRVLFGTDWPWQRQDENLALLGGLDLEACELEKIRHANARLLFGL